MFEYAAWVCAIGLVTVVGRVLYESGIVNFNKEDHGNKDYQQ